MSNITEQKDINIPEIKLLLSEYDAFYNNSSISKLNSENISRIMGTANFIKIESNKIQRKFEFFIPQYIMYEIVKLKYGINQKNTIETLNYLIGLAKRGGSISEDNSKILRNYIIIHN